MATCILYQNEDSTISIIDIPRSIELAQGTPSSSRRLLSTEPLKEPFPSTEPKSQKARDRLGSLSIDDLLSSKHLQFALDEVKAEWKGEWCLPRALLVESLEDDGKKRKRESREVGSAGDGDKNFVQEERKHGKVARGDQDDICIHQNFSNEPLLFKEESTGQTGTLPPNSTIFGADINLAVTRDIFIAAAPKFDLIIMDPPWPNRSARRKKSYGISYGNDEIRDLLSLTPIESKPAEEGTTNKEAFRDLLTPYESKLAEDGTVAIWVTNKEAFRDLLLQSGGLFEKWGITLVEEWIWLKTTITGEPICLLDSMWRKPYEILLIGKRGIHQSAGVKRRVLIAVPDLHSRKPNLKELFDQYLGKKEYKALEVFARNMTAGWWSWGNEVLKFQMDEHWVEE